MFAIIIQYHILLKLVGADERSGSGGLRPFQWTDKGLGVKKAPVLFLLALKTKRS
jgi:hypothetical protein